MDIEQIITQMKRDGLRLDETETIFNQTADDRNVWRVWTNDVVWVRRLAKKGARLIKHDKWGVAFDLDDNQVRIHKPITDEQREAMVRSLNVEQLEPPRRRDL